MDFLSPTKKTPWIIIATFLVLSLVIVLAGIRFYSIGKSEIKKNIENDLSAIANLKVSMIETWRQERLANATVIRDNQIIANRIDQWLKTPSNTTLAGSLLIWMAALQRENGYQSVLLLDAGGKPRLGTRADDLQDSLEQNYLRITFSTQRVVFSDLYRTRRSNKVFLDLYAPLVREETNESKVVAILVLRIDPYQYLYPLIQSWPTPSRSAETLFVRRAGNNVLFLNELRHLKASPLTFSFPLDKPQLPAAEVARGKVGVMEGIDYRGVPVLAALRAIPNTPWFMVSKVDTEEVYAPIRERAWIITIMVLMLLVVAGTGVTIWWKHLVTLFYRRELEAERERQALAQKAVETRSQLAAIVESSGDAIIGLSLDGWILSWNPGAKRIFGYPAEEVLQRPILLLIPTNQSREIVEILTSVQKGTCIYEYETVLISKNGNEINVSLTLSPIPDAGGQISGISAIARDITERKQNEAERMQWLEREREARQQAEEANRMKDEFLATVSHELRTPLNPILGWAYALRTGEVDSATRQEALETIERNARIQSQLVEDLLDVSRIISGKLRMEMQPICLIPVIEAAVENIRLAAQVKRIDLRLNLDAGVSQVAGDFNRLQQVIWNLLSNAVKFTPEEGWVEIRLQEASSHVEIVVTDSGEGIPADFLPFVFDRFRQADSSITRKQGGLGLGLAIARNLVELHGGKIQAENGGDGKGAVFTLKLPAMNGISRSYSS